MSANGNFYRFDDVTIDCENFRVQKDGRNITLTPRAFDVLIFLIKNSGRVVEKQEIFDQVWKDTFVGDNALTKIIKEIRQAINDDASQPRYIETVPKRGYRFIANIKNEDEQANQASIIEKPQQEISDREIRQTEESLPAKRKNFLLIGAIVSVFLILALGFLAFSEWRGGITVNNAPIDSIAVLPFENTAGDANLEYLSDGITENIINTLSRLPNLRVSPRTTVFYYKNKPEDPRTIGQALRVRAVLTGRIVQRGDVLTIQTDLIDVDRSSQIWGQQYNRPSADVINLQTEIANTIAERLRLRLSSAEQKQLTERSTENPEAFRLYLKGRFFLNKRTEENIKKSIEYFNQAIELDPAYALAYTGIADAYITLGFGYLYSTDPSVNLFPAARTAALKALAIDNNLAEAHVSLGMIKERYEWDFAAAEREYLRAIELNPDYPMAHHRYGLFLWAMERFDEANAELARARELDPLSAIIHSDSGLPFYSQRQHDKAIEFFKKAIEIEPDFRVAHYNLARSYAFLGRHDEAIAAAGKSFLPAEPFRADGTKKINVLLAQIYAMTGRKPEAQQLLAELEKQPDYIIPFTVAGIYAALGEKEKAFALLEKAYEQRSGLMVQLKVMPLFDSLRDDPRYQELLEKVGFPQ